MPGGRFGAFEHRGDAAGHCDVVVLDQHRVVEAEAVIEAAAAAHRVFLQRPQSRRGLARADDARLGVGDARDELRGGGGDAGKMAEEIERDTLGAENGAGIAGNRHQLGPARDRRAVARMRHDLDVGRQPLERGRHQRQPGDHPGLPRIEHGAARRILRHRRGRSDVAGAAEIFFKRARHRRLDLERGQKSVGTQQRHGSELFGNPAG